MSIATLKNLSLWRFLGILLLLLAMLVGGTWVTVKTTTDRLLYLDATDAAQQWARFLAANVDDLEQIAAGELPSSASVTFFEAARKSGQVYRYTIFNQYGYSVFVSDRSGIAPVDLSEFSAAAAQSVKEDRTIVDVRVGGSSSEPSYFAESFVPVAVGGRPVAVVASSVDQTAHRDEYYGAFLRAATVLCLLSAVSFGIPAVAWYFRTRQKQQADRRIRFLAHHDPLTGLVNRAFLVDNLDRALATLPLHGDALAVHFIDIDRFKEVNDSLGHDAGDLVLKTLSERLLAIVRSEDIVSRHGGDEFVVVQRGRLTADQIAAFADRIAAALAMPIRFQEQEIVATVSIGVAAAPADAVERERLLKCADLALYKAKQDGRNCIRHFLPEMDAALVERLALEKTIREAVASGRFVLHFQPMLEMEGNKLVGFEALVRLPAPDGTLIPPMTFLPVAEDMRLVDKIGAWVLQEACRTAATWPNDLMVAVNLSPSQFDSGEVERTVADALNNSGLDPKRLELEITETLLLRNTGDVLQTLQRLKATGVSIVMDDFGTGYSSLAYLWKFPFDKIKIDRSFMEGFEESGRDVETVVKTIIALGREMNMRVTVEGVETPGQVDFLYDAKADQVQGFYFGKAIPASEVGAEVLKDFRKKTGAGEPAQAKFRLVKPSATG